MTAHASAFRDTTTRDDLERTNAALLGFIVEHLTNEQAERYGRAPKTLRSNERRQLEDAIAPLVWGRVAADTDESERWREIAGRQSRGET